MTFFKNKKIIKKAKFTTTYGIDTISFSGPEIW